MALKSYEHQSQWFQQSRDLEYFGVFWEMGLGKSKLIIDTIVYLYKQNKIRAAFITTNKTWYLNWVDEVKKHMPEGFQWRVVVYGSTMSQANQRLFEKTYLDREYNGVTILLFNIEAMASDKGFKVAEKFLNHWPVIFVIDESTCIKSPKALRTKRCMNLRDDANYRRILTGTPVTNSPLDFFSQLEFLHRGLSGQKTFTAFKNKYAIQQIQRFGTRAFLTVVGYQHLRDIEAIVAKAGSVLSKAECLDLPEKLFVDVWVDMTPAQKKLYQQLQAECMLVLDSREISVTAAVTMITKLYQIVTGFIITDEKERIELDNNRIGALLDIADGLADEKIIIWCKYRSNVEAVTEALQGKYKDTRCAVTYYGGTSVEQRRENIAAFKTSPSVRFLVASEAAAKALTLVESNTNIYYSVDYKLETWLQSQDRTHRIGQSRNVTYYKLRTRGTVEDRIYAALEEKKDLSSTMLSNIRSLIKPGE